MWGTPSHFSHSRDQLSYARQRKALRKWEKIGASRLYGNIAQQVERSTVNAEAQGSSPCIPATCTLSSFGQSTRLIRERYVVQIYEGVPFIGEQSRKERGRTVNPMSVGPSGFDTLFSDHMWVQLNQQSVRPGTERQSGQH